MIDRSVEGGILFYGIGQEVIRDLLDRGTLRHVGQHSGCRWSLLPCPDMENPRESESKKPTEPNGMPVDKRSFWTHPYFLYFVGNGILFAVGLTVAYLAIKNDWIPHR